MSETLSQFTAPNLRVEAANGVTYAYRRFGNRNTGALPLVCLVHYRGNLDNWDPILVDTLATQREVILVDNAGVGGSSGAVPSTVAQMARDAIAFVDAADAGGQRRQRCDDPHEEQLPARQAPARRGARIRMRSLPVRFARPRFTMG